MDNSMNESGELSNDIYDDSYIDPEPNLYFSEPEL
jgi:hypothetical protein